MNFNMDYFNLMCTVCVYIYTVYIHTDFRVIYGLLIYSLSGVVWSAF